MQTTDLLKKGRKTLLGLVAMLVVLSVAGTCFGAGFGLYEWSARGMAMGGALVARGDDATANAYNPAALTSAKGIQAEIGATAIAPSVKVNTEYGANKWSQKTVNKLFVVPNAYFSQEINDRVTWGAGLYTRYGLGTVFDDDWAGRYNSYHAAIESFSLNPNVAFKMVDNLSMSLGVELMYFKIDLRQKIDYTGQRDPTTYNTDIDQKLKGTSLAPGGVFGLHYYLGEPEQGSGKWTFGAVYRTQVKQQVSGDATYDRSYGGAFQDSKASASIVLPDSVTFGVGYQPLNNLSFEVDAMFTRWSTYKQLTINYDDMTALGVSSVTKDKHYSNVWRLQAGVEYGPVEWLDLRAGYVYDQSPINDDYVDYLLPANNRHIFNFGAGLNMDWWGLDLAYSYLMMEDRNVDARQADGVLAGSFKESHAHMISLDFNVNF